MREGWTGESCRLLQSSATAAASTAAAAAPGATEPPLPPAPLHSRGPPRAWPAHGRPYGCNRLVPALMWLLDASNATCHPLHAALAGCEWRLFNGRQPWPMFEYLPFVAAFLLPVLAGCSCYDRSANRSACCHRPALQATPMHAALHPQPLAPNQAPHRQPAFSTHAVRPGHALSAEEDRARSRKQSSWWQRQG